MVRVTGPVVDVEFLRAELPPLFNALTVEIEVKRCGATSDKDKAGTTYIVCDIP